MGNKASKVGEAGRVLSKNVQKTYAVNHTRVPLSESAAESTRSIDSKVAERLQKLGPVPIKTEEMNYKPSSEDNFTITLAARQKIEEESANLLEQGGRNKLIPPQTITAILSALKDGDSIERVKKAYNLDDSILPKLSRLSLPDCVNPQNELLDQPRQSPANKE